MLSAGTPLMAGGDEYLRSLQCNNNPYDVDSVANWLNYTWNADQTNFNAFAKGMIAFRRAHAALRPLNFYSNAQLTWWTPSGTNADTAYFTNGSNHAIAYQLSGSGLGDSYLLHLRRLQWLERQRELHSANGRRRIELVPRHGYLRLGRRTEPGSHCRRGRPYRRTRD